MVIHSPRITHQGRRLDLTSVKKGHSQSLQKWNAGRNHISMAGGILQEMTRWHSGSQGKTVFRASDGTGSNACERAASVTGRIRRSQARTRFDGAWAIVRRSAQRACPCRDLVWLTDGGCLLRWRDGVGNLLCGRLGFVTPGSPQSGLARLCIQHFMGMGERFGEGAHGIRTRAGSGGRGGAGVFLLAVGCPVVQNAAHRRQEGVSGGPGSLLPCAIQCAWACLNSIDRLRPPAQLHRHGEVRGSPGNAHVWGRCRPPFSLGRGQPKSASSCSAREGTQGRARRREPSVTPDQRDQEPGSDQEQKAAEGDFEGASRHGVGEFHPDRCREGTRRHHQSRTDQ